VAICTYNGGDRLGPLVTAVWQQAVALAALRVEILVVDNNSTDDTPAVVARLEEEGVPVRRVQETRQGIPFARNRAVAEAPGPYLAFIDDDELPGPDWLATALDALRDEGAQCVGGKIEVVLPGGKRPSWMIPEVEAFLGRIDHGDFPAWVTDTSMPIYSGNVAYNVASLGGQLNFDSRYNRAGTGIGGGSDGILFRQLVEAHARLRYRPEMVIEHHVGGEKVRRSYFLRLHFKGGVRHGAYQFPDYPRQVFGVPPFLVVQALRQAGKTLKMLARRDPYAFRQAMNLTFDLGCMVGCHRRWRDRHE
jgi:glycosyltransferase involved in cell wall biosynthesis